MRKKHFEDADELKYFFDEYVADCKKRKEIPNLAGFAVEQGTTTKTLYEYRKPEHPYCETMTYIFDYLQTIWLHNGKLSDRMKEFLLKAYIPETFTERRLTINNNINNNLNLNEEKLSDEDLIKRINEAKEKLENLPSLTIPTT